MGGGIINVYNPINNFQEETTITLNNLSTSLNHTFFAQDQFIGRVNGTSLLKVDIVGLTFDGSNNATIDAATDPRIQEITITNTNPGSTPSISQANDYSLLGNFIYGVSGTTLNIINANTGDGITRPLNLVGSVGTASSAWGASWQDREGNFYAFNNGNGNIYRIADIETQIGTTSAVGTPIDFERVLLASPSGQNDGFGCEIQPNPLDWDGDGVDDIVDLDDDNDGILDTTEFPGIADPFGDSDGDNTPNYNDPDTAGYLDNDSNGINDKFDVDGDGIPNAYDLDSDNDGIPDNLEGQSTVGYLAPTGTVDTNGIDTAYGDGLDPSEVINTDAPLNNSDIVPDYLDSDSDNDGESDTVEALGNVSASGNDFDFDGIDDNFDNVANGPTEVGASQNGVVPSTLPDADNDLGSGGDVDYRDILDTDGDGVLDDIDADDDNDGILDADEFNGSGDPFGDEDGDGLINLIDTSDNGSPGDGSTTTYTDTNLDGIPDIFDTDSDGRPNHLDLDSDNDGIPDTVEAQPTASYNAPGIVNSATGIPAIGTDTDGIDIPENKDGEDNPDFLDLDSDNDGFLDIEETGNGALDTDNDGRTNASVGINGLTNSVDSTDDYSDPDGTVNDPTTLPNQQYTTDAEVDYRDSVIDSDRDGVSDDTDLDDDNDGIPDSDEGARICTQIADINTPGFTSNANLVSGGITGTATLNGLASGVINFTASVSGTANWTSNGIQVQNQAPVGNFIYAQPRLTDNSGTINVATYTFDLPNPVSDFEFFLGGLNNDDQVTVTAFIGATPITVTSANFSDFSTPGLVVTGNSVRGTVFDGSADPLINTFKVTILGDVDQVVITSGKADDTDGNVTVGMYSFAYCSSAAGNDFDGDGIPNSLDLDSDDDGILDVYEAGGTDANMDGMIDGFTDADNDGLNDAQDDVDSGSGVGEIVNGTPLPLPNTDGTGRKDYLDIDADDDGIVDNIEGQATATYQAPLNADDDMDGIDNQYDIDFVGNNSFSAEDTESDGLDDYVDRDSDGDTIDDIIEGWDNDANGTPSVTPQNVDFDGDGLDDGFDANNANPDPTNGQVPTDFPDMNEPGGDRDWRQGADADGDGVFDGLDLDDDNDGIPDSVEGTNDSDSDGIVDSLDLDSDNDGVTDVTEAGGTDLDGDGLIDNFTDTDDDGLNDAQDNINGGFSGSEITNGTPLSNPDSDIDGLDDRVDRDSDNDGLPDVIEAGGIDDNGNGIIDGFIDTDDDGLADSVDPIGPASTGTPLPDTNSDSDGIVDRIDIDSDNDGLTDTYEAGGPDANGDGRIDGYVDADNDGFDDNIDTDDSTTPAPLDGSPTAAALPQNNFDNDGRPDYLDRDSDNDGITDTYEAGGADDNRNGEIDGFIDTNSDGLNDATLTSPLPITNTDSNGNPDYLDIDADDDGIVDNIEGQPTLGYNAPLNADSDNDGIDNQYDIDFVGNNSFPVENTDGDALDDFRDLDSDNDTIDDIIEGWDVDANGTPETAPANSDAEEDGLDDNFDSDDVNSDPTNGQVPTDFPDAQLPGADRDWRQSLDIDGDGVNDNEDLDNDNDGIPDSVEGTNDSDGDGIPDYLDLDSDNDGVPDIIEAGGTDTDGDGHIDYPTPGNPMSMNDSNNDGLDDDVAASPLPDIDSDNDGLVDRLDLDSDNDGITDLVEAGGTDANADGEVDYATPGDPSTMTDTDRDGFIDIIDSDDNTTPGVGDGGTTLPDNDTDGDNFPNRLDLDSDNDGIHDVIESGGTDSDSNGTADDDDENVDNTTSNGIPTSAGGGNTPTDTGADASPDYLNLDSDEDGCSDANEAYVSASADGGDGGQFGTGTPATTGALGLVTTAAYDTGVVATVTDATDATACIVLDTDGDGVLDDQENTDGTDPNDPCDFVIANISEPQSGDWLVADCDGDGVTNGQEVADGTNPEDPCDFNSAGVTLAFSGDYLISDCDGDGVTNGDEISDSTDPSDPCDFNATSVTLDKSGDWLLADCDGDTITNGQEVTDGTNPDDPCSSREGTPPSGVPCDIIIETDLVNPGVNDGVFMITNIESYPNNTVHIYNRWGILVFETQGYDNSGNGFRGISNGRATINESKALPVGVYFYVIEYVQDGNAKVKNGYLYVNR